MIGEFNIQIIFGISFLTFSSSLNRFSSDGKLKDS